MIIDGMVTVAGDVVVDPSELLSIEEALGTIKVAGRQLRAFDPACCQDAAADMRPVNVRNVHCIAKLCRNQRSEALLIAPFVLIIKLAVRCLSERV